MIYLHNPYFKQNNNSSVLSSSSLLSFLSILFNNSISLLVYIFNHQLIVVNYTLDFILYKCFFFFKTLDGRFELPIILILLRISSPPPYHWANRANNFLINNFVRFVTVYIFIGLDKIFDFFYAFF